MPDLAPQRLFEIALKLFQAQGYPNVTPAEIAAEAGVPLDELYRHYPRQERFVFKLYERLALDLEACVPELPSGTVAQRFSYAMQRKLALLMPHWELFRSLIPVATDPTDRLAVLGKSADRIRARVQSVFAAAVYGASDAPPLEQVPRLARFLYAAHLMCVFVAFQDQTPTRKLSDETVAFTADLATLAAKFLAHGEPGPVARMMAKAAGLPDLGELATRADKITSTFVQPPHDPAHFSLAEVILRDLFQHRRLQPGAGGCAANPCPQCLALHLPRVEAAIAAGEPISMVLPAFPAKSANPKKVLGALPDFGEELALRFLHERCEAIRGRYPPGATITICSDGRVFNDLVGVSDEAVTAYREKLLSLISRLGLTSLEVFDLDDVRPGEPFAATRAWLMEHYAEPLDDLIERTRQFEHHRQMHNGIHRFLTEDLAAREPNLSKTQARNQCKELAYEVIRRSNAWSRLISVYFPDALRLSIHPQPPHAEKVGILLTPAENAWLTPWHGTVLVRPDRFLLMHRAEAEALGAKVVVRDGQPSYFELQ